jgi:hypothetical protein
MGTAVMQNETIIETFICSEVGGHKEIEDAFELRRHAVARASYIGVVADGQGGQRGGGPAARLACAKCIELALTHSPELLLQPTTWSTLLRTVDETIANDPAAGYTTLAAFCLTSHSVCGASSGDSAVVLFDSRSRANTLTERQHKNPPVGSGAAVFVPFAASLQAPWTFLAMTDGVWKYVGWDCVAQASALADGREIIPFLRERAALPATGRLQDDFTMIVLRARPA